MFMPASSEMSTSRVAAAISVDPHALKKSPAPPNVPVPKLSTGTRKPEAPSVRYSMIDLLFAQVYGGGGPPRQRGPVALDNPSKAYYLVLVIASLPARRSC